MSPLHTHGIIMNGIRPAARQNNFQNELNWIKWDYTLMEYFWMCQAWEPVHSSKGFTTVGSQRHSRATQSWGLAAAGRLPRQPRPAWALPLTHHQGKDWEGITVADKLGLLSHTSHMGECEGIQAHAGCVCVRLSSVPTGYRVSALTPKTTQMSKICFDCKHGVCLWIFLFVLLDWRYQT